MPSAFFLLTPAVLAAALFVISVGVSRDIRRAERAEDPALPRGLRRGDVPMLVIGAALLALAGFVEATSAHDWALLIDSQRWMAAQGTVVSARVSQVSTPQGFLYAPDVTYSYRLGGQEYSGHAITFNDTQTDNEAAAAHVVQAYPRGKVVDVYVDPADPTHAVLLRSIAPGRMFLVAIAVPAMFLGAFLLGLALGRVGKVRESRETIA